MYYVPISCFVSCDMFDDLLLDIICRGIYEIAFILNEYALAPSGLALKI